LLSYGVALLGRVFSFSPVFATDVLHAGPSTFGLLLAAPGIGAVVAGLGIASLVKLRPAAFRRHERLCRFRYR
jgi:hypothetical protein